MKTKKQVRQIVTLTFAWVILLVVAMFAESQQVKAVASSVKFTSISKDKKIKSADTSRYQTCKIEGLTADCNVTVTTSNKDVVALEQGKETVETLSYIGAEQKLGKNGTWSKSCGSYVAMGAGKAVITITVTDTSDSTAEPLTQSFNVTVKKTTPKVELEEWGNLKNNTKYAMWSDGAVSFMVTNVSRNAKFTIQCNKDKVFYDYFKTKGKRKSIKKSGTAYDVEAGVWGSWIPLKATKTGTYKLKITLTQDGESYTYPLTVTVKKYENPISNLTINNKNYTSGFAKHSFLGETNMGRDKSLGLFQFKEATFKGSVSLKSGYTLEGIYVDDKKIKTTKSGGKYTFTINATSKTTGLVFLLKDSKGNYYTVQSHDV